MFHVIVSSEKSLAALTFPLVLKIDSMKTYWSIVNLIVLLACLGCGQTSEHTNREQTLCEQALPPFLAGIWQADRGNWRFEIETNGTISNAIVFLNKTMMSPDKITTYPTKFGGTGIFEPGPWTLEYDPEGRMLEVQIVIKHFYQDMGDHAMEGDMTDLFRGPVSEDGQSWQAEWHTSGKSVIVKNKNTDTAKERKTLNDFPEPVYRGDLVFRKIEE